jgi:hypothetical protein
LKFKFLLFQVLLSNIQFVYSVYLNKLNVPLAEK